VGSSWKNFLLLGELENLATAWESWTAADLARLDIVAVRFYMVRMDSRSEGIAYLRGFQQTERVLNGIRTAWEEESISSDPLPLPPP
jgi:hypothetical protein